MFKYDLNTVSFSGKVFNHEVLEDGDHNRIILSIGIAEGTGRHVYVSCTLFAKKSPLSGTHEEQGSFAYKYAKEYIRTGSWVIIRGRLSSFARKGNSGVSVIVDEIKIHNTDKIKKEQSFTPAHRGSDGN